MKYLVLTMRRPDFAAEYVEAHYAFLDALRDRGLLEQAGPFTDRSGGAYVLRAASIAEAEAIASGDPLAVHNCSTITVREWDAR